MEREALSRATLRGRRLVGAAVLIVAGVVGLPATAFVLDDSAIGENLILPVYLAAMLALGVVLALILPGLGRPGAGLLPRVVVGLGCGLLAAGVGLAVFWFLLNGVSGA